MRKPLSASGVALSAICMLAFCGVLGHAQDRDQFREHEQRHEGAHGTPQDWSHHHVIYTRFGRIQKLIKAQEDSRAIQSWQDSWRREWRRDWNRHHFQHSPSTLHTDWSISLGGGTTGAAMYPAKFTFDPGAPADCNTDFVVYPVSAAGGATQPNIVGFKNLYSGTTGGTGICNAPANGRTITVGVDDGVSATTLFSYNVKAGGGIVSTSPALSSDGTKIAFVETGGGAAHFHVLAWKSGDGVPTNLQAPATAPAQLTGSFSSVAPAAGSGTVTDLLLGATTDTLSSPFVVYNSDTAYVGNDSGTLFRIINVFCTQAACTPGTSGAPALDATWGSSGALATGCPGLLTGAVEDFGTGNIFVGCSDGKLYGFTPAGVALSNSPLVVGDGTATGGIVDPPLIDVVNEFVYVVSGSSGGGTQVVVQASTIDLSGKVTTTLAAGGNHSLHAPTFNNAYLTGTGTPLLYEVSGDSVATDIKLYGIGFTGHVMNTSPANTDAFSVGGAFEISPLTEFFDGTEDRLFESYITAGGGDLASFNINSFPLSLENNNSASVGQGTTGIVIDNSATGSGQAASVYFGALGANTAVKLTQSGLQ